MDTCFAACVSNESVPSVTSHDLGSSSYNSTNSNFVILATSFAGRGTKPSPKNMPAGTNGPDIVSWVLATLAVAAAVGADTTLGVLRTAAMAGKSG